MKKRIHLLLLSLILLLAIGLRFWQLGSIPASLDWDEASLGYNAYAILHTGKDEYGIKFPIILTSFGDYKPALYTYFAIPSVAVFGLTPFAVRLPSAVFGVLSVLALYFLVKELLGLNSKSEIHDAKHVQYTEGLALLSAFLLAVSPWNIQFSRVAFEANVGVALSIFAALFFLLGLKKNIFLLFSAFFLGVELYAYQSDKVFAPLFALVLVLVYFRQVFKQKKLFLIYAFLVGLLVALPMGVQIAANKTTLSRAASVSIFSGQSDDFARNVDKLVLDHSRHDVIGLVLDNRRVLYIKQIIGNYISHFDLNWLFIKGDIPRHHAPGMGLVYLVFLPFLFIGLYSLIFGAYPRRMKYLILLWFLLAPLPASVTTGVPHAVRTMHFLPAITIIIALGLFASWQYLSRFSFRGRKLGYACLAVGVLLFVGNFVYYLNQYFVQLNYFDSEDWQYGYKQAVSEINTISSHYQHIVFSNNGYLDQSYIFYLFYTAYPPRVYQKQMQFIGTSTADRKFGKFEFRKFDWQNEANKKDTLFIGMPKEFPDSVKPLDTIHFLDGSPAIEIVGT